MADRLRPAHSDEPRSIESEQGRPNLGQAGPILRRVDWVSCAYGTIQLSVFAFEMFHADIISDRRHPRNGTKINGISTPPFLLGSFSLGTTPH